MKMTKDTLKCTKKKYKVKNWSEYNQALITRGSITLWIPNDIQGFWYGDGHETYSDRAIEVMLEIKAIYHLPLRSVVGFVTSVFKMSTVLLDVPDYTTISWRAKKINVRLKKTHKDTTDMILDSTGTKVFGEGEWKVRKHGWNYRRTWRKIHIAIDSLGEIRAVEVTHSDTHDCMPLQDILDQEDAQITDFYGDGAYDTFDTYQSLLSRGVTGFHIPPQHNAKIQVHGNTQRVPYPRDENLRAIRKSTRKKWKQDSGYHTRSLGETIMYRYKTTFGQHLSFRTPTSQNSEILTKCNILNRFNTLGMPESYAVT